MASQQRARRTTGVDAGKSTSNAKQTDKPKY